MDLSQYDFVDFGCSAGGSIRLMERRFGGRGIGFDIDPAKVEKTRAAGYDAEVMDLMQLDPRGIGTTRFAVMYHFLEHLPTLKMARQCILSACLVAREFVLIQQPYFDADPYLFRNGLKLYWSDWGGHPLPMTSLQLHRCILPLLGKRAKRAVIGFRTRLAGSEVPEVHALQSTPDQHGWEQDKHPPKPAMQFDFPVYKNTSAVILTGPSEFTPELRKWMGDLDVIWDSAKSAPEAQTVAAVAATPGA